MNINNLFDQFVGGAGNASATPRDNQTHPQGGKVNATSMLSQLTTGTAGGFAGGLVAGGLLGTLIGNKKMRKKVSKTAGGALGYGGSAVLGALALKAYQNWQSNSGVPDTNAHRAQTVHATPAPESFDPTLNQDATGQPMQLALVKAMIAAANADGHIDSKEQAAVFNAVEKMALDAGSKAMIFDVLRDPPTVAQIAGFANGLEQASEIYMVSRLAIDPDHPSERQYLRELADALALPNGLIQEIEAQFDPDPTPPSGGQMSRFGRDGNLAADTRLSQY